MRSRTAPGFNREPFRPTGLGHPEADQVRTVWTFGTRTISYGFHPKNSTASAHSCRESLPRYLEPLGFRPAGRAVLSDSANPAAMGTARFTLPGNRQEVCNGPW